MSARNPHRIVWIVGLAILIAWAGSLLFPSSALACPNCKEALANDTQQGGNLVQGFFWSILFMMSMPFAILGTFSGYMYYEVRKARHNNGQSVPRHPASNDDSPLA